MLLAFRVFKDWGVDGVGVFRLAALMAVQISISLILSVPCKKLPLVFESKKVQLHATQERKIHIKSELSSASKQPKEIRDFIRRKLSLGSYNTNNLSFGIHQLKSLISEILLCRCICAKAETLDSPDCHPDVHQLNRIRSSRLVENFQRGGKKKHMGEEASPAKRLRLQNPRLPACAVMS